MGLRDREDSMIPSTMEETTSISFPITMEETSIMETIVHSLMEFPLEHLDSTPDQALTSVRGTTSDILNFLGFS